jgi:hypothetical protein
MTSDYFTTSALVVTLAVVAGCASREPTTPNSQAEALRIVTLCSGGLSNGLSAKLKVSYTKYSEASGEGSATAEAKGIIFSDDFTKNMTGVEKTTLADKYVVCMQAERSRK